jgi:hypothetical protein
VVRAVSGGKPIGPIAYKCQNENCERRYTLGAETAIYLFLDNPLYNHLRTECPDCGTRVTNWNLRDEEVRFLIAFNTPAGNSIRLAVVETTPPFIVRQWEKDCLPGLHELTEEEEETLMLERWMLESGESDE